MIIADEQTEFRAVRLRRLFGLRIVYEIHLQHQQDLCHEMIDFQMAFHRVRLAAL